MANDLNNGAEKLIGRILNDAGAEAERIAREAEAEREKIKELAQNGITISANASRFVFLPSLLNMPFSFLSISRTSNSTILTRNSSCANHIGPIPHIQQIKYLSTPGAESGNISVNWFETQPVVQLTISIIAVLVSNSLLALSLANSLAVLFCIENLAPTPATTKSRAINQG